MLIAIRLKDGIRAERRPAESVRKLSATPRHARIEASSRYADAICPPAVPARRHLPALPGLVAAACALALGGCGGQGSVPAHHSHAQATASPKRQIAAKAETTSRPATLAYLHLFDLAAPVQDPASAALGPSQFVLLGGLTAADISTDAVIVAGLHSSAVRATLPNAQHDAQAAMLGGNVYVFGGGQFTQYDHILAYDPTTGLVQTAGALPSAASDVAVSGDGSTGYVIGGFDGVNWLNTVLAFTPGSPPRVVARLPVALRYAAAAAVDGYVLVAGGSTSTGTSDAIYRIDPSTGAVSVLGHLPAGLTHAGAGVIGNTMYLVGGRGEVVTDRSADVWAINPTTGMIRRAATLPQPLSDAAVVSLGDRLIVAGGSAASGTQATVGELMPSSA
jgi:N-acetylneuraminic acid mutarotase